MHVRCPKICTLFWPISVWAQARNSCVQAKMTSVHRPIYTCPGQISATRYCSIRAKKRCSSGSLTDALCPGQSRGTPIKRAVCRSITLYLLCTDSPRSTPPRQNDTCVRAKSHMCTGQITLHSGQITRVLYSGQEMHIRSSWGWYPATYDKTFHGHEKYGWDWGDKSGWTAKVQPGFVQTKNIFQLRGCVRS